jgi:type II secretion system protein G
MNARTMITMKSSAQKTLTQKMMRGFTLIEIMVVLVIMGILAGLVVPKLMGRTDDARVLQAKQDISTMMGALKNQRVDLRPMVGKQAVISVSCRKTHGAININTCHLA